jgi:hypothetical protein
MTVILYYLEGNREHLVDVAEFHGRHPGEAITRAKEILSKNARSQNDQIKIYSIKEEQKKAPRASDLPRRRHRATNN